MALAAFRSGDAELELRGSNVARMIGDVPQCSRDALRKCNKVFEVQCAEGLHGLYNHLRVPLRRCEKVSQRDRHWTARDSESKNDGKFSLRITIPPHAELTVSLHHPFRASVNCISS